MRATELLATLTRSQVDRLFNAVKALPADRISWQPNPECRSALDQLQEIATIFDSIPDTIRNRKLNWNDEMFAKWLQDRKQYADLEQLEKMTREGTERLIEFMLTVDESELGDPVEMPFPGDFRVYDLLSYHYWNMGYHEGQINYIGSLLRGES